MIDVLDQVRQGDVRAIARLITGVENDWAVARRATAALYEATGKAHIVGITGAPGCGKSTLVNEMAKELHARGYSVGIVAVDPSSPFTRGALLGDRVRMSELAGREGIFIRSMASRGTLGGLAEATSAVIRILDAAGHDYVLVETVGAGQAEVEIASVAHTILVLEAPGAGDGVQTIKAGILEIADILVVNKADRPAAANTVRALEAMLQMEHWRQSPSEGVHHQVAPDLAENEDGEKTLAVKEWQVPVMQTTALEGEGIVELLKKIEEHRHYLQETGQWLAREQVRSRREIERLLQNRVLEQMRQGVPPDEWRKLVYAVAERKIDPYEAAERLFERVRALPD